MQVDYISVEAAIPEFRRLTKIEGGFDKKDILAFANDTVDRILTGEQFEHKIALIPVRDYKAELPYGFKNICQVAYRSVCDNQDTIVDEVVEITQNILGEECNLKIEVNCPNCHEPKPCGCETSFITVNADKIFSARNPQSHVSYMNHFYDYGVMNTGQRVSPYHSEFILIRKTTSSFFNVPYHISECVNFNLDCNIEYNIVKPNLILNVQEGEILLSYYSLPLDENGYLMIPNEPTVIKAVTYGLVFNWLQQKYLETFESHIKAAMDSYEEKMERWISRAKNKLRTPEFDDLHSFVTGFIHRMVPKHNYWEDLMRRRGDTFKYPRETYNLRGYRK